ncbi:MAG: LCP family protein [Patescibacteria group bacterium]
MSSHTTQPTIDLLKATAAVVPDEHRAPQRKGWGKIIAGLVCLIAAGGLFFGVRTFAAFVQVLSSEEGQAPILEQLGHLVSNADRKLDGEDAGKINILLLGMGGDGHPGGKLADTILVASINTESKQTALISIPRDLVYDFEGRGYTFRKINSGYYLGESQKAEGGGVGVMRRAVENVTGLTIPYWAGIDFEGFRKMIDNLGGVDIVVDKPFSDRLYPTYSYGYQTVTFEKGPQHLNGEKALQYARSRHGNNGTGSDFDRSRRQKMILGAIKQKALSLYTLFNPTAMTSLLGTVSEHVRTNIELSEMARFWEVSQSIQTDAVLQLTIDNGASKLLHSERGDQGAYTLVPNAGLGNYKEIRTAVKNIFSLSAGAVAKEHAKIELQNGTKQAGLAGVWKEELLKKNYQIINVGNAARTDYERTVIYDLTGQFP